MHLIRIGAISGYKGLVTQLGGNPVELCRQVGISPSQFREHNTYISLSKMALLLERSAVSCRMPFFGLRLGLQQNPGVLGDLMVSSSQEPTLGEALALLDNNLYLHSTGVQIRQQQKKDHVQIELSFDINTQQGINQLLQLGAGHLANLVAKMMGVTQANFKIALRQQEPPLDAPAKQPLYSQIQFDSSFDGLLLPCSALTKKPCLDQEALQRHLRSYLQQLKRDYPKNLPDQVRSTIRQLLPSNDCCIETVAANLDMHPRKLQRQLQRNSTSYSQLLKETRRFIAEQHLSQGSVPITDLALSLGYAHVSVFSRDFKQWTGCPPQQWRLENHTKPT